MHPPNKKVTEETAFARIPDNLNINGYKRNKKSSHYKANVKINKLLFCVSANRPD